MIAPFDAGAGLIKVKTRLSGLSGSTDVILALDTGAMMTLVDRNTIEHLRYNLSETSNYVQMTAGSGVDFVPEITIARLETIRHERTDFLVLCHTLPPSAVVASVLGLGVFRDKRLVPDFRAGIITLD